MVIKKDQFGVLTAAASAAVFAPPPGAMLTAAQAAVFGEVVASSTTNTGLGLKNKEKYIIFSLLSFRSEPDHHSRHWEQ
jgi:hypothetical protein